MHSFWQTESPAWKLKTFGYLCGTLGTIVLIISATFLALYEFTGASSFLDAEILGELRSLIRLYAFAMVPALGLAFLTVPFAIRTFLRETRRNAEQCNGFSEPLD